MLKGILTIFGGILFVALMAFGLQTLQPAQANPAPETILPTSTPLPVPQAASAATPEPSPTQAPVLPTPTLMLVPSPTALDPQQADDFSACKNRVNVPESEMHWLYVPQSASELSTYIDYVYLAGQLIQSGAVDASACPAGGLGSGGYANACGLASARTMVYELQNAYDQSIMDAWDKVGVPPVMLKQLLHYESSFWPAKVDLYHYGLGQLTYYGAHTGLTWWLPLRWEICAMTGTCDLPTVTDPEVYALLNLMDAGCSTCEMKVDLYKAQKSIYYLSEVLMGHCYQTSQLVFNATGMKSGAIIDYATIWKLTLLNYNAGPTCVFDAVRDAYKENPSAMTWNDIRRYLIENQCKRGAMYVYEITEPFYDFPPK